MNPDATLDPRHIPELLRGKPETLLRWIHEWKSSQFVLAIAAIFAGSACYGVAMGLWRSPLQAFFVAIKFPLILLFTAFGNALANGMMAPLLGLNIGFRQALLAILMSFVIAAAILGAFSPLMIFLVWNAPPISQQSSATAVHGFILVLHVLIIASAGISANVRLIHLLRQLSGSNAVAAKIFIAWLGINLLLGAQLSWMLRPFIGSPDLPVEFLRSNALQGNFYEAVFAAAKNAVR